MKIFIGAENIISPLGSTIEKNFEALLADATGIEICKQAGYNKEDLYLSKFKDFESTSKFKSLLNLMITQLAGKLTGKLVHSEKLLVIISTTKGDLDNGIESAMLKPLDHLRDDIGLWHRPLLVSNACTSGVIAINTAANLIRAGLYEHVMVIGIDLLTNFVVYGFQSLYAISEQPCKPFDINRNGVSLGEGCAGVILSINEQLFIESPLQYLEGTSSNDANHISGPSRTGEGLFRTIEQTLLRSGVQAADIDFISAHGTATQYNDDMESIAFNRAGLNMVSLNSLKGYYGHTLGAAGVIETAICMQSMRHNTLIKSKGFAEPGTTETLNLLTDHTQKNINIVLKTASGFSGCNASLLLKKI